MYVMYMYMYSVYVYYAYTPTWHCGSHVMSLFPTSPSLSCSPPHLSPSLSPPPSPPPHLSPSRYDSEDVMERGGSDHGGAS